MNITLEKWSREEKEKLIEICNAADRTYLADRLPYPYTENDAEWWLDMVAECDGKQGIFRSISADGAIVGNISVEQKEDIFKKDAEIGYFIVREQWSKGIATDAVRQVCDLAFEQLDIVRITGKVFEANIASRRVLEKNDFALEGIMRDAVTKEGQSFNLCVYGRLKER